MAGDHPDRDESEPAAGPPDADEAAAKQPPAGEPPEEATDAPAPRAASSPPDDETSDAPSDDRPEETADAPETASSPPDDEAEVPSDARPTVVVPDEASDEEASDTPPSSSPRNEEPSGASPGDRPTQALPDEPSPAGDETADTEKSAAAEEAPSHEADQEGAPTPSDAPALSEDADIPPPTSVPMPAPYTPPKVVPPARIDEVRPDRGPVFGETTLVLSGDHLYRESIVRIGGDLARTVGADAPRELRVVSPPRKRPGSVELTIQNPNSDVVVVEDAFRYEPLPPPQVASVAPDHVATKGGEIQLVGEGFVPTSVVRLDGQPAKVTFVDATTLDVHAPGGADGRAVSIEVANPDGQRDEAKRAFVYDARYD